MKRVLIVEDDAPIRELLLTVFAEEGYAVAGAPNGELGLARCASFRPDLVVLDLMMPVLDGAGFLRERAAHDCAALVVVISAARHATAIPAGAAISAFIEKPFDLDYLTGRVRGMMVSVAN